MREREGKKAKQNHPKNNPKTFLKKRTQTIKKT